MNPNATSHTYLGKRIDVFNIDRSQIELKDIAHHLSMICRYGGACFRFYSVAEHAVHVSNLVYKITGNPVAALMGLHHDDHEAYVHDIRRPLKSALVVSPNAGGKGACLFSEFEDRVQREIVEALLLPEIEAFRQVVKHCDNALLAYEMEFFWPGDPELEGIRSKVPEAALMALGQLAPKLGADPECAKGMFLTEHDSVAQKIGGAP